MRNLEIIDKREILGFNFKMYGDFENPLFLAKDVAKIIEHSNPTEMIKTIDNDEKLSSTILSGGQNRVMTFVTEDGLYEILMQSRKPIAKQFKKEVKGILKDLRKGNTYIAPMQNNNNDLFMSIFAPAMEAMTKAISDNMNRLQIEMDNKVQEARNIITDQEIKHIQQIKETRELIGLKSKNTLGLSNLLKTKISDLKGYTIRANEDYHYQLAKQRLFKKYNVNKWEDMPIDSFNNIHADIDSIEDIDDLFID